MKMGIWLRKAVLFAAVLGALGAVSKTVEASASEFIRGADISILSDMEKSGAKYYEDDISKDALEILKIMVSTMFDCVCGRILIIVMEKVMEQGQMIWKRRLTLQNEQKIWDLRCCWIFTTVILG